MVPTRLLVGVRLLLVVCSISLLTLLLLLGRCSVESQSEAALTDVSTGAWSPPQRQQQQSQLAPPADRGGRAEAEGEVRRLTAQVRDLERRLHALTGSLEWLSSGSPRPLSPLAPGNTTAATAAPLHVPLTAEQCVEQARRHVSQAELLDRGRPLASEFEMVAFSHFTLSRVYPVELALGKRVVEKPIGFRKLDLLEALMQALETLNSSSGGGGGGGERFSLSDFSEGVYRTEPTTGTQYELVFRGPGGGGGRRVTLARPLLAPLVVGVERLAAPRGRPTVHVLLPLAPGPAAHFRAFMDKFVRIALKNDRRVQLTVVFFGEEGLADARSAMSRALSLSPRGGPPDQLRLLALNESFSRSRGLRVAADRAAAAPGDALLFLCDVHLVFSARFLDRCRWNAQPGKKVYYPIVFSLYNPHVVYTLQGRPLPPEAEQLVISRDTGFWQDADFATSCQYRSDFLKASTPAEDPPGWGGEGVSLYRRHVRSPVKVVRATDPGIFRLWHPKECSRRLPAEQLRACLRMRALSEASHAQLGLLAFRDESRHA
ncbi:chondroitin sulfate N-acetylgalactosaminyltransferase 2-like [Schistocerca serialis cubense]|uniref:chondroitin sulfate N-acetylgalactosaminyltransferase 2-like n=1 Tax=Schistocerca serialis cubense TaxID=2023355 RepID=UPI00214F5ADB|nr:chondroitin sulfate N-acetylgalactosaminyltransferase 2-like [Schistocerca serialis cubense]